jgi:hypothetical protein
VWRIRVRRALRGIVGVGVAEPAGVPVVEQS